ncbi:MAG: HAMP domain-containing sensor histidine kinase [Thermodesulfovibrionales bacterium]
MRLGSKRFLALALFTALLIILVNLAWWLYYQRTESMLERQLSRRLQSIAGSLSHTFTAREIDSLSSADYDLYSIVLIRLNDVCDADSLAEVFILDDNFRYLFTTSPEQDSIYFLADLNGSYIDSLFYSFVATAIVTPAYRTGELTLKSAFAPLIGADRSVVAVLGVEANVDYFKDLQTLKRNLLYATVVSVFGGLALGMLFLILQQRLNKAEQQLFLGQTHAYLGQMVAVVSHELKNPLMIIRGSAERLIKKTGAEEASYILEETDRLNNIVNGYLAFAKAEGPLLQGESIEQFDLAELARTVARHLEERFSGQAITWSRPMPTDPIPITGYRRSLRQVILNLLVNGVESCIATGRPIKVGIEIREDSHDRVKILISDSGPGIAKKDMKNLFVPFYTSKQSGSGLGLFVSRRLTEEMSGSLQIQNLPDNSGLMATVELPKNVT